ncbi:MAG: hypothetical protein WD048_13045 [Chitinophagales bacterium]
MSENIHISKVFLFIALVFLIQACKKDDGSEGQLPVVETIEASSITHSSARSGGQILDNGEGRIFRKGICWSLTPNPNIDRDSLISDDSEFLEFESVLSKLIPNTTYYIRAYASNINGVVYGEEISFTTGYIPQYSVGDIGPAGGYVFYDKGEYSDFWRYLESASPGWYGTDSDPELTWGCFRTYLRAVNTEIGFGEINTSIIVAECGNISFAAKTCADYSVSYNNIVYSDWFLPSKDELNQMYLNLKQKGLGELEDSYYWSSSEMTALIAWLQGYDDGLQYKNHFRFNKMKVRPVRAF